MRVSSRRVAIAAAVVAGLYLVVLFSVRRVPDRALEAIGGPSGVRRDGGLILRYRPPASYDAKQLEDRAARRGVAIRHEAELLVVEVPGVTHRETDEVAATLTHRGLEFRAVLEDMSLLHVAHDARYPDGFVAPDVHVEIDPWWDPEGLRHNVAYLVADHAAQLTDAFEQLVGRGWARPAHSVIAYERIAPSPDSAVQHDHWRSFLLGDEVLLDGDAVLLATPSSDPRTGQPVVLIDFDRAGSERFGEITARLVGHKLAMVVGGRVKSAPIINSAIRGGRASIAMGGGLDPGRAARDAASLAAALNSVSLPPGGVIESQTWVPPTSVAGLLVVARLLIGVLGGALVGLVIGLVIAVTRPVWQPGRPHPGGRFPIRRVAVTLLAPVALFGLERIALPGLENGPPFMGARAEGHLSIVELGLAPILAAHVLVELVALAVPRWRRVRLHPAARLAIGRWVAIVGVVLAVIQSHLVLGDLAGLSRDELLAPGLSTHLAAMASLTTGTLLLVIVAGMIRQHGLGNGYGALIASGWALAGVRQFLHITADAVPWFGAPSDGYQLGLATLAAIGCGTVAMLRMRVGESAEPPMRVPSSGHVPLVVAVSVAGFWLVAPGQQILWSSIPFIMANAVDAGWYLVASLVILVPIGSFAWSRPAVVARLAERGRLAPPSQASWRRAMLLTFAFLALLTAASLASGLSRATALPVGDAVFAMIAAAVGLDILDDLQARRSELVAVWPLHQAQHAELVRRVLADAGIACHLQASHLRTLLAFFGPFVPIDVLVPAADAARARAQIEPLFA